MRQTAWILVANKAGAQVFRYDPAGEALQLERDIPHPEGRASDQDLATDHHHSRNDPFGQGQRRIDPVQRPTEREQQNWARELAEELRKARGSGAFDSLMLVAEPQLLGELGKQLDPPTERCVKARVAKNLAAEPDERVREERLRETMQEYRQALLQDV